MQESLKVCAGFIRDVKLDPVLNDQLLDDVYLLANLLILYNFSLLLTINFYTNCVAPIVVCFTNSIIIIVIHRSR